jgi:hypothetical protein
MLTLLPGSFPPAYSATACGRKVTIVKSRRPGRWVAAFQRHPGPGGQRQAFGTTPMEALEAAIAIMVVL